jgi:phage recombination protein Bet
MTHLATTDLDMDLIKRTIAVGASNDELALFAAQCRRTGLDPFSRQINFVLRKSRSPNGEWVQKATIMISIDGARLVAARTGLYNGSRTWWCGDDSHWVDVWLSNVPPAASKVSVTRGSGEFTGTALWREYGAPAVGPLWKSMPAHMLAKCAEMLALRKAFPAELSGLYSADEMAQADGQVFDVAQSPAPARIVAKDKPTRICEKLTYYKHPAHLLATIRKEENNPDWEWPADDDVEAWEYVWNTAKEHANKKESTPPANLPEPTEDTEAYNPTDLQASVDRQVQNMLKNAQRSAELKNKVINAGGKRPGTR